jgi:hypothetical protein
MARTPEGILAADEETLEGGPRLVRARGPRPAGADNDLRLHRSIDEHVELRRISLHEFAMFTWLGIKADPHTSRVRTNWLVLAQQTGFTANHVEQLCRSLRRKGYIGHPLHRSARRVPVELAINPCPLVHGVDRPCPDRARWRAAHERTLAEATRGAAQAVHRNPEGASSQVSCPLMACINTA